VGVNFAVVGQIDGNVPGPVQVWILQQIEGQVLGGLLLFFSAQVATILPQAFAKFTARQGIRVGLERLRLDKLAQNKASRAAVIGCGP